MQLGATANLTVTQPRPARVGTVLAQRYRLDAIAGRGGTSIVYRATDLVLDQPVAVKFLAKLQDAHVPKDVARSEAVAAMRLSHSAILRVFHYAQDPVTGGEYLVMEYLAGENGGELLQRLAPETPPLDFALHVGDACLAALEHAHRQGIVHHDVKPGNVILARTGAIKLCDFGICAGTGGVGIPSDQIIGTPAFMSPERIRCDPAADHRSDLYSLGATLYTFATGRPPFGSDWPGVLHRHLRDAVPSSPKLGEPAERFLARALAKRPEDRYESAHDMRAALGQLREALSRPPPPPPPAPPPRKTAPPIRVTTQVSTPPTPEGMVFIPAAALEHGIDRRPIASCPIYLDRHAVTNRDYHAFVATAGVLPPAQWYGNAPRPGEEDLPVVGIRLAEAAAFAAWRGCRLPTHVEFELAARRPDGRACPWGAWHSDDNPCHDAARGGTGPIPVDELPEGASYDGAVQLLGNVWEWTIPDGCAAMPPPAYSYVLGGSYRHACVVNGLIARSEVEQANAYLYLGFRCARDV